MANLTSLLSSAESKSVLSLPSIRGLGNRIWAGIVATANPAYFKCLSAYLRFCGLTGDAVKNKKYSRDARRLYHMLAERVVQYKNPIFRPIYDNCRVDITSKNPNYTKRHIHNAALNRTATMLAKQIYRHVKDIMVKAGE